MKNNKYSDYKIFHFREKLNAFVDNEITAPVYVRIKPINLCNHGCFFCVYSTGFRVKDGGELPHVISGMHEEMNEKDQIPAEKMYEILNDLAEIGTKAVTYSGGGEPLMHPDITGFMKKTLELGLDLSIITNGQNLVKDRAQILAEAKWVRVSMDYTNGEQMKLFRNIPEKSFNGVIKNLETFSKIKNKNCDLSINYIVHNKNYKNLFEFTQLLKNSGVNNVRYSPMYTDDFLDHHMPIKDYVNNELMKISSLKDKDFTVNSTYRIGESESSHSNTRNYSRCFTMQTVPVIGADLNLYSCHNKAYDSSGLIGSLKGQKFKELWFSKEAKEFFESFNPKLKCMHECSADRKNNIINEFVETSKDNFV